LLNSASEYETSDAEDENLCEESFGYNGKESKRHKTINGKANIPSPRSTVIKESNGQYGDCSLALPLTFFSY
ncbi:hypothetical protein K469DRAFT_715795, partial [Zopfia rhizophila CBS 207.26]